MPHLCDTNILLRFVNANDPEHGLVGEAVRVLLLRGEALYYTQQNRREFWNVCTRPAERLAEVDAVFQRLPDPPGSGQIWDRLVTQYGVQGVGVHDAQLVASMLAHGIPTILTLNDGDFRRYAVEIAAIHPASVLPPAQAAT